MNLAIAFGLLGLGAVCSTLTAVVFTSKYEVPGYAVMTTAVPIGLLNIALALACRNELGIMSTFMLAAAVPMLVFGGGAGAGVLHAVRRAGGLHRRTTPLPTNSD